MSQSRVFYYLFLSVTVKYLNIYVKLKYSADLVFTRQQFNSKL